MFYLLLIIYNNSALFFCFLEIVSIPSSRGLSRSARAVDIAHYQIPRPQSSLGTTGKQGISKLFFIYFSQVFIVLIKFSISMTTWENTCMLKKKKM